ncbi:hypothetical protein DPMN_154259 [Dreissena polymorpha]|uniref:Uncharacterized protein n=1 Tax=Dreissena polymorpha TaxID=45954 RepID=A0A9D4FPL0_DREPO|nr:hypothetical protein DPMN_154259 [Dreissena polymorpha]
MLTGLWVPPTYSVPDSRSTPVDSTVSTNYPEVPGSHSTAVDSTLSTTNHSSR